MEKTVFIDPTESKNDDIATLFEVKADDEVNWSMCRLLLMLLLLVVVLLFPNCLSCCCHIKSKQLLKNCWSCCWSVGVDIDVVFVAVIVVDCGGWCFCSKSLNCCLLFSEIIMVLGAVAAAATCKWLLFKSTKKSKVGAAVVVVVVPIILLGVKGVCGIIVAVVEVVTDVVETVAAVTLGKTVVAVDVRKFDANFTVGEEDIDILPQEEVDDDDGVEDVDADDEDKDDGDNDNFVVVICKLSKLKTKSSPAFICALSIPLSLEKSAHVELAEEEFEEVVENDDNELQEDKGKSHDSFEHVSISFLEISLIDFVRRVSAVSGKSNILSVDEVKALSNWENAVALLDLNSSLAKLMPLKILLLNNLCSWLLFANILLLL